MPKKGFYKCSFIVVLFLIGLYICANYTREDLIREGFVPKGDMPPPLDKSDSPNHNCPNVLVQKGPKLFLYNSRKGPIPGVNPIQFENLEEYVEFTKWLKNQNIKCPILFLQHSYDAQDKPVYQFRPDPIDLQGGLPSNHKLNLDAENAFSMRHPKEVPLMDAGRENGDFNKGSYPSFDEANQYVGIDCPLDKMFNEKELARLSDNPMDSNWGGVKFSRDMVAKGLYRGEEVFKQDRNPKNKIDMPYPPLKPDDIALNDAHVLPNGNAIHKKSSSPPPPPPPSKDAPPPKPAPTPLKHSDLAPHKEPPLSAKDINPLTPLINFFDNIFK